MTIQYEKLFEPYTNDGHTLEASLKYIAKEAADRRISTTISEMAINEIFQRLANGYEYPKDRCPCGCGIDKAATALIHAIRDRMIEIDADAQRRVKNLLQVRYNNFVAGELKRISDFDKQYIKMNRPPIWERSEVCKAVKWIFSR